MVEPGLSAGVALAVLAAALLHAGWNALIRGAPDKPLFTVLMHTCSAGFAGIGLLFTGWPDVASFPYLAISALLHSIYIALLMRAYEGGQLAVGYVFMRGLAPPLVGLASALMLYEALPPTAWAGIAAIVLGVLIIALSSGRSPAELLRHRSGRAALLNAVVIASYTLVDGQGARVSANPLAYALALALCEPVAALAVQWRRQPRALLAYARQHGLLGALGGLVATTAYAVVLWAMTQAPIAVVAALRESSIVFAVLIGSLWFKEGRFLIGTAAALCVLTGIGLLKA